MQRPLRGIFITGTDTEVGKTMVAAAVCAALVERGLRVAAFKPVVTGLDESEGDWPPDHELLASVANVGQSADDVAPLRFGPPVSPHHAAELAGTRIEPAELASAARGAAERAELVVCEGVGGLMVPLTTGYLVRDLAIDLHLPLLVAARPGLGTINHSLMTVEAARAVGLDPQAVVMTPWPAEPSKAEVSNRETVERLGGVPVAGLPPVAAEAAGGGAREAAGGGAPSLAAAGEALPLDDWLSAAA